MSEQKQGALGAPTGQRVARLSPLNLANLLRREVFDYSPTAEAAKKKEREPAKHTHAYACPKCDQLHRRERDAEECCQGPVGTKPADDDNYACLCPVCGSENESPEVASDCCLWKDLDAPTRHAIATKVEQGSTWARELGLWPPKAADEPTTEARGSAVGRP